MATFNETAQGGVVAGKSAVVFLISRRIASGGLLTRGSGNLSVIRTGRATGGVVCRGLSFKNIITTKISLGGICVAGQSRNAVLIFGQGGIVIQGTAFQSLGFVAKGGLNSAGLAGVTFFDYVDGTGGVKASGLSNNNHKKFYRHSASGGVTLSGNYKYGVKSRKYNPLGGVLVAGSSRSNLTFYMDTTFLWNLRSRIFLDTTFLWNTGRLINYWYRIVGRDKCSQDPCCQRYIINIHARSLSELCEKLSKRKYNFSLESAQRFSKPADNAEVAIGEQNGEDYSCNEFEDVPLCDIPKCAEFCVLHDVTVDFDFDIVNVQKDAFFDYVASDGVYMTGSATASYQGNIPAFEHSASGGISISGEADYIAGGYVYVMSGGLNLGGTSSVCSSVWSFIGGEWPNTTEAQLATVTESLPELDSDQVWSLTERVISNDGLFASTDISYGQNSQYLIVRGFGFDVPDDSQIMSVYVTVQRKTNNIVVRDLNAYLLEGDDIISSNMAKTEMNWPYMVEAETVYEFTDSIEVEDINSPDFGFGIRISSEIISSGAAVPVTIAYIDFITIEVVYENISHQRIRMGGQASVISSAYSWFGSGGISIDGRADVRKGIRYTVVPQPIVMGGSYGEGLSHIASGQVTMGGTASSRPSYQKINGFGGASLSGLADVKPYFEQGTAGLKAGGTATVAFKYRPSISGGVKTGGNSFAPQESYAATASGGISIGGVAERKASHWTHVTDGNVAFVLGGADYSSSDLGIAVEDMEFDMVVDDVLVAFGEDQHLGDADPLADRLTRCGCGDIPLVLNLEHGIAKDNNFAQFLRRNSLTISKRLKMEYNVPNDSWQCNLHYRGLSPDANSEETWDIMFDVQCTQELGGIFIGRQIWKFGMEVFRKNLSTGADFDARIIIGVLPDEICGANELKFTVKLDTQSTLAEITPSATIYQSVLYDDIGLFKNRAWITNPDLYFTVSQAGLDAIQPRINLTDKVLVN